MQDVQKIIDLIDSAIKTDTNQLITEGNIIKDGYDSEVDELRNLVNHSHDWLNNYTQNLI
jgi:DNA mismatch repair protein MutS